VVNFSSIKLETAAALPEVSAKQIAEAGHHPAGETAAPAEDLCLSAHAGLHAGSRFR
jgi:hypothetical protein